MRVQVDKSGKDVQARGVDVMRTMQAVVDLDDSAADDPEIGAIRGRAGAIDDGAPTNDNVQTHALDVNPPPK